MKLQLLLPTKNNLPAIEVMGLTCDSRKVKKDFAFFAIKGANADGHDYIEKAIANGAAVVIGENPISSLRGSNADEAIQSGKNPQNGLLRSARNDVPYIKSENIRRDLAIAAARFYKPNPQNIAVVTGTNGKTSVADFTRQLWELSGIEAASIGTLGFIKSGKVTKFEADNTTPDPILLNELLTQVKGNVIIEGSSIGLEQHRLEGLKISAAAFTNFTQDHLDYHRDMEEYFRCKKLLFSDAMLNGIAVLNADIPQFAELKKISAGHKIITYGKQGELKFVKSTPEHDGQTFELEIGNRKSEIKTCLVGSFQAENILCAIGIAHATGGDLEKLVKLIPELKPVPGRMEQPARGVYVDYAHTPDALQNAINALKPHTDGKIITVFGCGGDRDKSKRPLMGKIACAMADLVIVTDDNPRTEKPEAIRKEILAACSKAKEIANREDAIKQALALRQKNDIVLIAGKGHEKYQIYGTEKMYFDDAEIVKRYT